MKYQYDLVTSIPVYKSVSKIEKYFLPSLKYLGCDVLSFIVTSLDEDTKKATPLIENTKGADVALFQYIGNSTIRSWGLMPIWCIHNGIKSKYAALNLNDGDEFIEGISNSTIPLLDKAYEKTQFALCTFNYVDQAYNGWGESCIDGHLEINPEWVDGQHFVKWEDMLLHGIMDGPPDFPNPLFCCMEYTHRARYLSGRPLVAETTHSGLQHQYVFHHRKEDMEITNLRADNVIPRIQAGSNFWKTKYGIPDNLLFNCNAGAGEWPRMLKIVTSRPYVDNMKKHVAYNNIWLDWEAMYQFIKPMFRLITSNCGVIE